MKLPYVEIQPNNIDILWVWILLSTELLPGATTQFKWYLFTLNAASGNEVLTILTVPWNNSVFILWF